MDYQREAALGVLLVSLSGAAWAQGAREPCPSQCAAIINQQLLNAQSMLAAAAPTPGRARCDADTVPVPNLRDVQLAIDNVRCTDEAVKAAQDRICETLFDQLRAECDDDCRRFKKLDNAERRTATPCRRDTNSRTAVVERICRDISTGEGRFQAARPGCEASIACLCDP